MGDKYLYSCAWSKVDDYVGVRTPLAFNACYLLDHNDDINTFERNKTTLKYVIDGTARQLTPNYWFTIRASVITSIASNKEASPNSKLTTLNVTIKLCSGMMHLSMLSPFLRI